MDKAPLDMDPGTKEAPYVPLKYPPVGELELLLILSEKLVATVVALRNVLAINVRLSTLTLSPGNMS